MLAVNDSSVFPTSSRFRASIAATQSSLPRPIVKSNHGPSTFHPRFSAQHMQPSSLGPDSLHPTHMLSGSGEASVARDNIGDRDWHGDIFFFFFFFFFF